MNCTCNYTPQYGIQFHFFKMPYRMENILKINTKYYNIKIVKLKIFSFDKVIDIYNAMPSLNLKSNYSTFFG